VSPPPINNPPPPTGPSSLFYVSDQPLGTARPGAAIDYPAAGTTGQLSIYAKTDLPLLGVSVDLIETGGGIQFSGVNVSNDGRWWMVDAKQKIQDSQVTSIGGVAFPGMSGSGIGSSDVVDPNYDPESGYLLATVNYNIVDPSRPLNFELRVGENEIVDWEGNYPWVRFGDTSNPPVLGSRLTAPPPGNTGVPMHRDPIVFDPIPTQPELSEPDPIYVGPRDPTPDTDPTDPIVDRFPDPDSFDSGFVHHEPPMDGTIVRRWMSGRGAGLVTIYYVDENGVIGAKFADPLAGEIDCQCAGEYIHLDTQLRAQYSELFGNAIDLVNFDGFENVLVAAPTGSDRGYEVAEAIDDDGSYSLAESNEFVIPVWHLNNSWTDLNEERFSGTSASFAYEEGGLRAAMARVRENLTSAAAYGNYSIFSSGAMRFFDSSEMALSDATMAPEPAGSVLAVVALVVAYTSARFPRRRMPRW
jgi:hypothetical protein